MKANVKYHIHIYRNVPCFPASLLFILFFLRYLLVTSCVFWVFRCSPERLCDDSHTMALAAHKYAPNRPEPYKTVLWLRNYGLFVLCNKENFWASRGSIRCLRRTLSCFSFSFRLSGCGYCFGQVSGRHADRLRETVPCLKPLECLNRWANASRYVRHMTFIDFEERRWNRIKFSSLPSTPYFEDESLH